MAAALAASGLHAQDSLPPWEGGMTSSLGQPSRIRFHTGGAFALDWRRGYSLRPAVYGQFGLTRTLLSPDVGLLAASVEAYGGLRSTEPDGGARVLLQLPPLRLSLGGDYNVRDNRIGFVVGLTFPVRRGGVFRGGTLARTEWTGGPLSAVRASVLVPVGQATAGRTRPLTYRVDIAPRATGAVTPPRPLNVPGLDAALENVRIAVRRLFHLVVPYLDAPGRDARTALAPLLVELRSASSLPGVDGPGLQVDRVVRTYHAELDRAFSIAASGRSLSLGETTPDGVVAADSARASLRQHLLYPYDRLLGQWKGATTLAALAAYARGSFARSVVSHTELTAGRENTLLWVFEQLLTTVEGAAREELSRWGDTRVVWLPLQLGLRPEDHDTQSELDAVVEDVVGARFTDGNRVWYLINQQFQTEVVRSIEQAEDYHVLWIHDFSGRTDAGLPDAVSARFVVDAYYRALIRRIGQYDRRRRLPVYMIFLDQHYYEKNAGRLWLDLLERPLGEVPRLPPGYEGFADHLRARQRELRGAIAASRLLQAEAAQYGAEWVENMVKVQVSITNPADQSFWSRQVVPLVGIPDNLMRDHRKIVFYDISEDDPYRGLAMYTGMGIGEHYVGQTWEDRAIMVQGPAVLSLKAQARALLRSQGITGDRVPYLLRPKALGPGYQAAIYAEIARRQEAGGRDQRAVELHNGTGFQDKQVSVAKAALYELMPSGAVVMAPDALWGNALFASLLTGSALRGCRVLFIAPSLGAAPSSNAPSMGVAHELFARLIVLQQEFGPELELEGGMLKTGIYNPGIGVQDVIARFAAAYRNGRRTPFLRRLFPVNRIVDTLLAHAGDLLSAAPDTIRRVAPALVMPKLHLKANFFASREAWDSLVALPEMAPLLETYIGQLLRADPAGFDARAAADSLAAASDHLVASYRASRSPAERERMMYFLMIGSANQDYRSMLMDGEASVLLSGWSGVVGVIDFSLIASLSVWIDDLDMLDALIPPPSALVRDLARRLRFAL
jgi:hypothetical protein